MSDKQQPTVTPAQAEQFERFRQTAEAMTLARMETIEVGSKRKPSLGICLEIDDKNRVSCAPGFNRRERQVIADEQRLDLTTEVEKTKGGATLFKPVRRLTLQLKPGMCWPSRWYWSTWQDDLAKAATLAEQFADAPLEVLRRRAGNCVICGRTLSDGESIARGVGPQCLVAADRFKDTWLLRGDGVPSVAKARESADDGNEAKLTEASP